MPAVRAHMVFAALADHGEMIGGVPVRRRRRAVRRPADRGLDHLRARGGGRRRHGRRDLRRRRASRSARSRATAGRRSATGATSRRSTDARAEAATSPRPAADAGGRPRRPRRQAAAKLVGGPHGPRRRRAAGRADALDGRARHPPHRGGGADRQPRGARPAAGDAGADPQLPGAAGDGHADPDDPGRRRLPALPAAGPRPVGQARQGGQARPRRLGDRAGPHRRRRARRSARAPRPQLARPWPGAGRRSALAAGKPRGRHAGDRGPPRRRQRRDRGA